jgi:hypothetical protein
MFQFFSVEREGRKLLENKSIEKWLVMHILTKKKTNCGVNGFV